jgi:flagellar biosynthesis protein FlhF
VHIKRFEAQDSVEAMRQVREELGPNAIILHTKPIRREGLRGLLSREGVEVLAAVDRDSGPGARGTGLAFSKSEPRIMASDLRTPDPAPRSPSFQPRTPSPDLTAELSQIKELLSRVLTLRRFDGLQSLPRPLVDLYEQLISHELLDPLAYELVARFYDELDGHLPAYDELQKGFSQRLSQMLRTSGPIDASAPGQVVAFVGPTGVGKTTTIAKLAAYHRVVAKRRVAILTVDTYRIGAVEQLKTYAEILDVPCEVAITPGDIAAALSKHATADLIFLDTTGRSPKNEMAIAELRPFLGAAKPTETHLLLGATGKSSDLLESTRAYRALGVNRLGFTKLDETGSYGPLVNVTYLADLPISYLTTGQEVPDDIEEAKPERLAQLVLNGA